jgi:hypothetical protein
MVRHSLPLDDDVDQLRVQPQGDLPAGEGRADGQLPAGEHDHALGVHEAVDLDGGAGGEQPG